MAKKYTITEAANLSIGPQCKLESVKGIAKEGQERNRSRK
jgi:hypothetical protein